MLTSWFYLRTMLRLECVLDNFAQIRDKLTASSSQHLSDQGHVSLSHHLDDSLCKCALRCMCCMLPIKWAVCQMRIAFCRLTSPDLCLICTHTNECSHIFDWYLGYCPPGDCHFCRLTSSQLSICSRTYAPTITTGTWSTARLPTAPPFRVPASMLLWRLSTDGSMMCTFW